MKSPSSVQQNLDFYVRWFDQNGWIIEDGMRMTEKNQGAVVATRQGDRWQLTFTPSDNATAMIAVLEER